MWERERETEVETEREGTTLKDMRKMPINNDHLLFYNYIFYFSITVNIQYYISFICTT